MTASYENPAAILQRLIQFDTTNPPGNEAACIAYVRDLLETSGVATTILARDPDRPNLIARLPGRGTSAPLLLYGHVDVVTTAGQTWEHPPFSGKVVDGYIWGRGALDMKGGVAMLLAAYLRAKAEGLQPPGDLILAILSDEENGGRFGAQFLVEKHADQFAGVRFALGEFGGFSMPIGSQRFYPICVSEKQLCWMKATFRGPAGHGSRPIQNGAMAKMARFVTRLDQAHLPVHVTPVVQQMIAKISAALPDPMDGLIASLADPRLAPSVLEGLGEQGRWFGAMLRNTASANMVYGGNKVNVIPGEVTLELDGRLLPGFEPEDLVAELRDVVGDEAELEVLLHDPGPPAADMGLFDVLAGILQEADPEGLPVPLMLTGVTDGRFFGQLGIQTYGFLPMQLPPDFAFMNTIHAANERVPAAAISFGADAIFKALQRF